MASGSIGEPNQDQAASPEQKAITEGGRTSMFWPGRESEAPLSTRSKTPTEDHLSFRKLPELPGEIRRSERTPIFDRKIHQFSECDQRILSANAEQQRDLNVDTSTVCFS